MFWTSKTLPELGTHEKSLKQAVKVACPSYYLSVCASCIPETQVKKLHPCVPWFRSPTKPFSGRLPRRSKSCGKSEKIDFFFLRLACWLNSENCIFFGPKIRIILEHKWGSLIAATACGGRRVLAFPIPVTVCWSASLRRNSVNRWRGLMRFGSYTIVWQHRNELRASFRSMSTIAAVTSPLCDF